MMVLSKKILLFFAIYCVHGRFLDYSLICTVFLMEFMRYFDWIKKGNCNYACKYE